jgi:hypothetical protein
MDDNFSSQPGSVSAQGGRIQPGAVDETTYTAPPPPATAIPVLMAHYRRMRSEN